MKVLRHTLVLLTALGIFLTASVLLLQQKHWITALHSYLHTHLIIFSLWRWLVITLFILFWPTLIRWLSQRRHWPEQLTQTLLARRWYLLGFFIAMESLFFLSNSNLFVR
jgi:hypothetical protein